MEKRKREDDGGSNGRRGKPRRGGGGDEKVPAPADEEVEEFFAILKRIQVAVKYFEERDARRGADTAAAARRWRPTFEREDFDGVKTEVGRSESEGNQGSGLDLNSDPGCDVPDSAD